MKTVQSESGKAHLMPTAFTALVLCAAVLGVVGFQSFSFGEDYAAGFGGVSTCLPSCQDSSSMAPNWAGTWGYSPWRAYLQPRNPRVKRAPTVRDLFFRPEDAPYMVAEPYRLDGRFIPVTRVRTPNPLVGYWSR